MEEIISEVSVDTEVFEKADAFIYLLTKAVVEAMEKGEFRLELEYKPKLSKSKIKIFRPD
ncbi:hypothetical protein [Anaerosporobacter faecicola]|uniref:hypothetical protein n=1 Tax=Anaerosporobacter faecicola TaxID=2718714 RepID=UPI00143AEAF1|nr:hypothetical protein [Anaerosporobacter faecicola]